MTDAELIVASRDDPTKFRELYDRLADDLLAYFYRRVLDAEVAADLLAETFAVAFERRGRLRVRSGRGGGSGPCGSVSAIGGVAECPSVAQDAGPVV